MKLNLRNSLLVLLTILTAQSFAQLNENFEPVQGQAMSVRDALIQQNWHLPDMDVNPEGTTPIDGAQSLATGPSYKPDQSTGMITPFLDFSNSEDLQFSYNIHRAVMPTCRRWFLVYIGDESDNGTLIDSVEVDGTSTIPVTYHKTIAGYPGTYRIYVNFRGDGCNGRFVVDDFHFTGNVVSLPDPSHLDANGTVMGIKDEKESNQEITLFPNPVNAAVNVAVRTTKNQSGVIEITNINGAKVIAENVTLNNGNNNYKINVNNLPSGSYYVTVKSEEGVSTKQFIKVQ